MVSNLPQRTTYHIGPEKTKHNWTYTTYNVNGSWRSRLLCAARFYGHKHLQLERIASVRVAHGIVVLPGVKGYQMTMTMLWTPKDTYPKFIQQTADDNGWVPALNIRELTGEWTQYRVIRFHLAPEDEAITQQIDEPSDSLRDDGSAQCTHQETSTQGRLSPIPEGTEHDASSEDDEDDRRSLLRIFYEHEDTRWQAVLDSVLIEGDQPTNHVKSNDEDNAPDEHDRLPLGQCTVDRVLPITTTSYLLRECDLPSTVELLIPYPTSNLVAHQGQRVGPGEHSICIMQRNEVVSYKVETNMTRREVVKRDDDVDTRTSQRELEGD